MMLASALNEVVRNARALSPERLEADARRFEQCGRRVGVDVSRAVRGVLALLDASEPGECFWWLQDVEPVDPYEDDIADAHRDAMRLAASGDEGAYRIALARLRDAQAASLAHLIAHRPAALRVDLARARRRSQDIDGLLNHPGASGGNVTSDDRD